MDAFLANVGAYLHTSPLLALGAVFVAGLLTASNPCVLATIPLMMGFVAGRKEEGAGLVRAFGYSLTFVLGLNVMFAGMGLVAALAGQLYGDVSGVWKWVVAVVCVVMGLHLAEFIRVPIPGLTGCLPKATGVAGAFLLGLLFGLVSAPCAGPILIVLLTYLAGADASLAWGALLLLVYGLGHSALVLVAGTSVGAAKKLIASRGLNRATLWLRRGAGVVIVLVGLFFAWQALKGAWAFGPREAPMKLSFALSSLLLLVACGEGPASTSDSVEAAASPSGVCPPFHLRDESGAIIDPVNGVNAEVPYSPRQTCGAEGCHDYDTITEGCHFTQGQGEEPTPAQRDRAAWVSTPGNYGGSWCSPAPLYRYLSPKANDTARTMDMTSYTFLTAGCGDCHPGGGSAEHDRDGLRYDERMADPASGLVSGGANGLDGDYFQARWAEAGVLEADCLLCHTPGYDVAARRAQIGRENFRWAATAGAGLAAVTGAVKDGEVPEVRYDPARFDDQGRLISRIVREPRNEACLSCHAKPGWKKRGANFNPRTDVHLRAGLKCVDCHPAGSSADNPLINGREVHQFAKGDDPGGLVRDDLDGTVRACEDCHSSGTLGAPVARHAWLPPLHLDELACQICHIPERAVKAALVQAGDVFNPGARIPSKGKHLWTFYGPDGDYWNHYGDLEMMGFDDKPTDPYRPEYARYDGKIYPVNRIHSAWPGIEIEGQTTLMQPKMADVYKMWAAHQEDPGQYPRLAEIVDDSGDGVPEVNRPAEIEALIASITELLRATAYPMERKRVVWVSDDRVYSSGTVYRTVATEPWEASPFANVHKYSHDVYPARAALGAGGCTDCHAEGAGFFDRPVLERAFGEDGRPVWTSGARLLGLSDTQVRLGAFREERLKPAIYGLLALALGLLGGLGVRSWTTRAMGWGPRRGRSAGVFVVLGVVGMGIAALSSPGLAEYMTLSRFTLDSLHFPVGVVVLLLGALSSTAPLRSRVGVPLRWAGLAVIAVTASSGALMLVKVDALQAVTRLAYTLFDGGLAVLLVVTVVQLAVRLLGEEGAKERAA